MENDEKQFFSIFGAWGILFFMLLLGMVDSIPETASFVDVIPDVILKASLALVYSSAITIVLILALNVCQSFSGWVQSTSDPNYGKSKEPKIKPQIEMDVFLLAKSIMETGSNTAVFLLFSKLPVHTQTPFIDDEGRYFMDGKQTDSETMLELLRDAARTVTPEQFQSVSSYMNELEKAIQKKDDL